MKPEEKLIANCTSEGIVSYCHLEVEKNGDLIAVRLGKHRVLDELTVNRISDELLGVADRPDCHRLLLDFSGVAQLSSAMLAKLVRLLRKMKSKGEKLRLCGVNSQLRSVFATTRLDRLFDITDNKADGLEAVTPRSPLLAEKVIGSWAAIIT
jgi:anti-sigma B factor antagonist